MNVNLDRQPFDVATQKIVCVGRNYVDHAKELNNPVPTEPILFIKPSTSLTSFDDGIKLPRFLSEIHHELEMALLVGQKLTNADAELASRSIIGVGLALDLTARDLQAELKAKGQPWELAKGFDGACPVTDFVSLTETNDWNNYRLVLEKNGEVQQDGRTQHMIFSIPHLLSFISQYFTLNRGDLVLTGTPAGVSALKANDQLETVLYYGDGVLLKSSTKVI